MSKATWIWYSGDFELYHSMLLHSRRQEFEVDYPCFWALSSPYPNVCFSKQYTSNTDSTVKVVARCSGYVMVDSDRYAVNTDIFVPAGDHLVRVVTISQDSFPHIYVNSEHLVTDESWTADRMDGNKVPVGTWDEYASEDDDPTVFPFCYEKRLPTRVKAIENGTLYDFGKETFGRLIFDADPCDTFRVVYGESLEEATDAEHAILRDTASGLSHYEFPSRAFRYVSLIGNGMTPTEVYAEHEYLPLEYRAHFSCDRSAVKRIWDICAYTLHLNSREFFLDGIKRDRWCWSGDAYQSYMANNYLFFDPEITKRTIVALLGKPPYTQHVNTINDYSMYLIIGAYDYYYATGDKKFIETYYPRLMALYDFIDSRTDGNGYVCERPGDWIFIDWSEMDKSGVLCAEQILFWKCRNAIADLSELVGADSKELRKSADRLKKSIMRDFWREDICAFIDCFTSGRENVTRHANIFAILHGFVSQRRARKILRSVLENDSVTMITTPYFMFFELCAFAKMGKLRRVQRKIESYWGAMVKLGASTIWEQYDPKRSGAGHYEMYGNRYGCSLCHAWGGGPIYLLGRYCLGVYPTSVAYADFEVAPNMGIYKQIDGSVPLPDGHSVYVKASKSSCTVRATRTGGVLVINGERYPIPANEDLTVEL